VRDPFGNAVGHARDDHSAVAVAHERHVMQIVMLDDADDVLDVRAEALPCAAPLDRLLSRNVR